MTFLDSRDFENMYYTKAKSKAHTKIKIEHLKATHDGSRKSN